VENRGFEALGHLPNVEKMKIQRVLFISRTNHATRSGVCSIVDGAIDRSPACVRS
jgi:hypothetical protein